MSDLPPPRQSLRAALSLHALIGVGILLLVALTGGGALRAFGLAGAYVVLAGGWSALKAWRTARETRRREGSVVGRNR
jgi:hypothetical protein